MHLTSEDNTSYHIMYINYTTGLLTTPDYHTMTTVYEFTVLYYSNSNHL